jgi:hypothetical protein
MNYEFAKKIFEERGETLPLQKYNGNKHKLQYICSFCHEDAFMSLNEFRRGRRCASCSKKRSKLTNLERYGVENPFQSEELKEKTKKTNLKKYGCEHHMQNVEVSEKALKSTMKGKSYIFPNGRIVHCQGYEPRCIDLLLETYNEDDILVMRSDMPNIWYNSCTRKGKRSIYYPDIFIPKENIVIEVKSEYTLNLEKDKENNIAKFKATVQAGYELHLYVFDKKVLLYRKVYTQSSITVYPHPQAILVFEEN